MLRGIYVLQARSSPLFDAPQMDALYHRDWALACARGEVFQAGPYFRAPLYPWFLGLLFRWFGEGYLLPRIVQAGLGALTTWCCFRIGRELFSRRVGLLGALFAATDWVLIYNDGELLLETLAVPLGLLALVFALPLARALSARRAALVGLCLGLAAIARPNVLLLAPFLFAWLWMLARKQAHPRLAPLAALTLGTLAPILPITTINYVSGHEFVLISTQAGVNLWIGNNPQADGITAIVPGTRPGWWDGYHDAIALAEREAGHELGAAEISRHYSAKAFDFMRTTPLAWLRLMTWKARLLCLDWELGNNLHDRFFAFRYGRILHWLPLSFAFLFAFGGVGLALALRARLAVFPLVAYVLVYSASVVAFFVNSRYRVPLLPVLCIFAAHGTLELATFVALRRFRDAALVLIAAGGLYAFSRATPAAIDTTDAKGYEALGGIALEHGEWQQAAQYFQRTVELQPGYAYGHRKLGVALVRLRRTEEGERELRVGLRLDRGDAIALDQLADLLLTQNRTEEALGIARESIERCPTAASGFYNLGRALLAMGGSAEAERAFSDGLAIPPGDFNCAFALARAAAQRAKFAAAAELYEQALAARPTPDREGWYWKAAQELLVALTHAGRRPAAEARLRALQASHPVPEARALTLPPSDG